MDRTPTRGERVRYIHCPPNANDTARFYLGSVGVVRGVTRKGQVYVRFEAPAGHVTLQIRPANLEAVGEVPQAGDQAAAAAEAS